MRKWLSGVAALILALGASSGPALAVPDTAGPLTVETAAAVSDLGPGETLTVSVTLTQRADLSGVPGLNREDRPAAVVAALQTTAKASQGPLVALLRRLEAAGSVEDYETFWVVNGASVTATSRGIEAIAALPSVESIDLPPAIALAGSYQPQNVEANLTLVGAPSAWARGITGDGVVVATLDTGVYPHADVVGAYRGGSNSWFDPYGEHTTPYDANGHGTATMSVIVGRDAGGSAIGVAPDATWISAKIFADSGNATASAIHQAFQWILDPDGDPSTPDTPDVVSNSWADSTPGCDTSFQQDLAAVRAAGILPVFAAGNGGPGPGSSRSPANLPEAFSVGAVNNLDGIYFGSSRGPSACAGDTQFPDLVAPGVSIKAADSSTSSYWYPTGTSLAAPHVAGALALLLQGRPGLTPDQQATLLMAGAVDLGDVGPDTVFGAGRLDIASSMDLETPNMAPVAAFSVTKGKKGVWQFDASASYDPDGTIDSYTWDFGDGSTATGVRADHKYSSSGTFTVELTVGDNLGTVTTTSQDVENGGGKGGGRGGKKPQ